MLDGNKVLFSGMQATGNLTLGNYLGALKNWVTLCDEYMCFYSVVDLHSITVRQDPAELRKRARNLLTLYIAAGIDPEKPLSELDEEICAWIREWFYMSPALKGKTIVFGHTPLCHLNGGGNFNVWFDPYYEDKIGIDGGLG